MVFKHKWLESEQEIISALSKSLKTGVKRERKFVAGTLLPRRRRVLYCRKEQVSMKQQRQKEWNGTYFFPCNHVSF